MKFLLPTLILILFNGFTITASAQQSWMINTKAQFLSINETQTGDILALSDKGELWCIGSSGSQRWKTTLGVTSLSSNPRYYGHVIKLFSNGLIAVLATSGDYSAGSGCVFLVNQQGRVLSRHGENVSAFAILNDELLYCEATKMTLINDNGEILWQRNLNSGSRTLIFTHANEFIRTEWPIGITVINQETGDTVWSKDLGYATEPGCISYSEDRILLSSCNAVTLVDNKGALQWTFQISSNPQDKSLFVTPALFRNRDILCALNDRSFICLSPDGHRRWQLLSVGTPLSPLVAGGDRIYATIRNDVIAVTSEGQFNQNIAPGYHTDRSPFITRDGRLVLALQGGGLYSGTPLK